MQQHQPCPHCRSPRDWVFRRKDQVFIVRCPSCHCHFTLLGGIVKWGARCPYFTSKGPRRYVATKVPQTELSGRQASLWSSGADASPVATTGP